ncbi:RNA polymerase sigma factor [Actinoplanes sp. NPDC049265]|uniref:RNA polymerase sigma factor n=1 Tax=Actinoplanes sp. NPDC049265 TaxID=3363902 RepID=UPI00371CD893
MEQLLRELAPQVLGALARRYGQFDAAEDAVQEALLAAATQWPVDGVPDNPRSWLTAVAGRRLVDEFRSESARRRREENDFRLEPSPPSGAGEADDTLTLFFLCCHPLLSPPSQLALTLRAVGGLSTAEIARAFLVPEATMAQRISRAKATIRKVGLPRSEERAERLRVVRQTLYLVFNEGYTTSGGPDLRRDDLTVEAIRITRLLRSATPDDVETGGLLALMLLTDARRDARTDAQGALVPLHEQDRSRWDHELIAEGVALVSAGLGRGPVGPYQLQAAIAALHDEAATAGATDWPQILALYEVIERLTPGPIVTLNKAVATGWARGPLAGLAVLGDLDGDDRMNGNHRVDAVRAHLLEMAGDRAGAHDFYRRAAAGTNSVPEQRYLTLRASLTTPEHGNQAG